MDFSEDIQELIRDRFPDRDIYSMSLEELKNFRTEVVDLRHEYSLIELANKLLGNGAYGSSASVAFYFFNLALAGDITGECRNLTKTMWKKLEHFFHEDIWLRHDLWKQFDFELDESLHDWFRKQPISVYSDTDSVYVTYGTFFRVMTPEYQKKYDTDEKKLAFILKFNKEYMNDQNNRWCEELYEPRHAKSEHEFELETVSKACIYLKKKKYVKGLAYEKGKFFDHPKIKGTGVELIKSTSPAFCREKLPALLDSLMFELNDDNKAEYIIQFNERMNEMRKEFYASPVEYVSQSVKIGNYKKYVIDDKDAFVLAKGTPTSVQAIARYNYLAHKNGRDDLLMYSGKIKYYNIDLGHKSGTGFFGFPSGELPPWSPPIYRLVQWQKNIIDPINRFLEVMDIPLLNASGAQQLTLFGF